MTTLKRWTGAEWEYVNTGTPAGTSGPWTVDQDAAHHRLIDTTGIAFDVDGTTLPELKAVDAGGFDGSPGIELDGTAAGAAELAVRAGEVYSSDYALVDIAMGSDPGKSTAVTMQKVVGGAEATVGWDADVGHVQHLLIADAASSRMLRVEVSTSQPDEIQSNANVNGMIIETRGAFPYSVPSPVGLLIQSVPDEKLAFFGATPVVQPAAPVTLGDVIAALKALGLVAT